jgi:hypothetical protein
MGTVLFFTLSLCPLPSRERDFKKDMVLIFGRKIRTVPIFLSMMRLLRSLRSLAMTS